MTFFIDCIKGIAIGAGAILPGISSGVLCVIFGIYEKILNSILGFFKDVKKNFKFLVPLFIGSVIGIVAFGNILNYLLEMFPIQMKAVFIGLILGSIPSLVNQMNSKEKFNPRNLLYFFIAFIIGIASVIIENYFSIESLGNVSNIYLIICGLCMSIGVVVPRS